LRDLSLRDLEMAGGKFFDDSGREDPRYHLDNGFPSVAVMTLYHLPIVTAVQRLALPQHPRILDLGCGNGALLAHICAARPDCVPCGIEREPERLGYLAALFERHKGEWHVGDMFLSHAPWREQKRYAAALLMVGRLTEARAASVQHLLHRLRGQVDHVIGYAYPDWIARYGGFAELCAAAGLTPIPALGPADFVAPVRL